MLQGLWIFILFILFNPGAKGMFCGSGSNEVPQTSRTPKEDQKMRMSTLEAQAFVQNGSEG